MYFSTEETRWKLTMSVTVVAPFGNVSNALHCTGDGFGKVTCQLSYSVTFICLCQKIMWYQSHFTGRLADDRIPFDFILFRRCLNAKNILAVVMALWASMKVFYTWYSAQHDSAWQKNQALSTTLRLWTRLCLSTNGKNCLCLRAFPFV